VEATLQLALCFHHAVTDNRSDLWVAISRLYDMTSGGDYAYYTDIAHFMADLPLPARPAPPGPLARQRTSHPRTLAPWSPLTAAIRTPQET
jgi:hypothetical protein